MSEKMLFQDLIKDGEEITARLILDLLNEVREEQKNLVQAMADGVVEFQEHARMDEEFYKKILNAFPGGDADGHRRYHASVIESMELKNKIIRECLINAAKVGFIAASGWLLVAIWHEIFR